MNDLNCILTVTEAISGLLCDENLTDQIRSRKFDAVMQAERLNRYYQRENIDSSLIRTIFEKRMDMIRKATTVAELERITHPKAPHYSGNGFRPANEYAIPEEEMIGWSITSLKAPLNRAAFERYMELFCQIYGALPGEPGFKGVR
jgi:hypothetical protein